MKKDVADMLPQYAADLAHHALVPIIEAGPVKVWRMKRPNSGSINMVEIILTSLGIIIHGDQHPTAQPVHARNGLGWFVDQLDSGYLASKFLRKQYTPQAARRHVEWCMESLKEQLAELGCEGLDAFLASDASGKAKLKASALHGVHTSLEDALERGEGLDNEFSYQETFAPILEEHDTDTDWLYPNQEYRPEDEALLAAIQQRFRALFWERYDKIGDDGVLRLRDAPPTSATETSAARTDAEMAKETITKLEAERDSLRMGSLAHMDHLARLTKRIDEVEAECDTLRARLRIAMQTEERPKGCQCDQEFGDSDCPMHPTCANCGESTVGCITTCHACGYQLDGQATAEEVGGTT